MTEDEKRVLTSSGAEQRTNLEAVFDVSKVLQGTGEHTLLERMRKALDPSAQPHNKDNTLADLYEAMRPAALVFEAVAARNSTLEGDRKVNAESHFSDQENLLIPVHYYAAAAYECLTAAREDSEIEVTQRAITASQKTYQNLVKFQNGVYELAKGLYCEPSGTEHGSEESAI